MTAITDNYTPQASWPAIKEGEKSGKLSKLDAIDFRRSHAAGGWRFLDLGAEWERCTGLPFVFACWLLRDGVDEPAALSRALRAVKARGLSARARLAAESNDPEFVRRYLTHYIRFDLREDEKRAIALFAALLRKHGLAETAKESRIRYI